MGPSAIALWHALMATANKARWPRDFSVAISTLRSKTGISKDALYTARNQLKQKGRIDYRERKGNQSTVYRIIPFASEKQTQQAQAPPPVSEYQTQTPTQSTTQSSTQTPTQTPNSHKQNKNININETLSVHQSAIPQEEDEEADDGLTDLLEEIFFDGSISEGWRPSVREAITAMYRGRGISVGGRFIGQVKVRERLRDLCSESVQWAVEKMVDSGEVRNPVAYLMACLYNAPVDYDAAISIQVERDWGQGPRIGR